MKFVGPLTFSKTIAYMLQNVEYNVPAYITWLYRTKSFGAVMYRRQLQKTKVTTLFTFFVLVGMLLQITVVGAFTVAALVNSTLPLLIVCAVLLPLTPFIWAHMVVVPLYIGDVLVVRPKNKKLIAASKKIFADHKGIKIAIAGSYGKTSMKELLGVVLGSAKNVAITPANKNVASSHAVFASKLTGTEDVVIVEFGEGKPGDVFNFCQTLQPNIAFVTGIAPAHLDHYSSLDQAAKDIFSVSEFVKPNELYVNGDSDLAKPYIHPEYRVYTSHGMGQSKVTEVSIGLQETKFKLHTKHAVYALTYGLLGRHTIGPVVAAVHIAEKIGMTKKQIEEGVSLVRPYEHRMQPRLVAGAWVIDDTYNGTIEGLEAGLALLQELPAKRKIYVTPGLVDQGTETQAVHTKLGKLIAKAAPHVVVLMKNSVTGYIQEGMQQHGFTGTVLVEDDPLQFYTNIESFVAHGDVVLMQNDWPDNYA